MISRLIVDSNSMAWNQGKDDPFRTKRLFHDPESTRRIDLIYLEPGHVDETFAYHSSAEESLKLGPGEVDLAGSEGVLREGDYFWRPPGWVHGCVRSTGSKSLVVLHGIDSTDISSGPVDRNSRPQSEAGTNVLHDDLATAIGSRGWVRNASIHYMPWQPGSSFGKTEGPLEDFDLDHAAFKVLSKDWSKGGGQTLLVRLDPGYRQARPGRQTAVTQTFVLDGSFTIGKEVLSKGFFFHRPAGTLEEPVASPEGATLFMKVDGQLDFL